MFGCDSRAEIDIRFFERSLVPANIPVKFEVQLIYSVTYSVTAPLSHRNKIGDKFGDTTMVTVRIWEGGRGSQIHGLVPTTCPIPYLIIASYSDTTAALQLN
jgi:hypothetical protein